MQIDDFSPEQRAFVRRTLQGQMAYYPPPIPRQMEFSDELVAALSRADRALGELSGVGKRLRNPHVLISPYLRREAVLSSRIEGTQSSLSEVLLLEAGAPVARRDETQEVINYVTALETGIARLPSLPLSLRMIRELHRILLTGVRGEDRTPGEFRRMQNWIGPNPTTPIEDAVFVPAPPEALDELLQDWESYIHEADRTPPLVRCALIHYQFETIHPFRDGNGRIGRLLMPLYVIEASCLSQPLLYVSAFLERHRTAYYDALMLGRLRGDVLPWILLFLEAVATQAADAAENADRLTALEVEYRRRIERSRSAVTHALIQLLLADVFVTVPRVARQLNVSYLSAQRAIEDLVEVGVLLEITGRKRDRVYAASEVLKILAPEEEPRVAEPAAT